MRRTCSDRGSASSWCAARTACACSPISIGRCQPSRSHHQRDIKDELPDLDDSWAWAHAQALGTSGLEATLKSGSSLSRLLCPRQLDPNTAYIACLVPAFDIGCKAGLGKQITNDDESKLLPAWRLDDPELITLQLPVYHTWEFSTGSSEDFESLVKKLVVRDLPATIGIRPMGVTNADPDLPRIPPDSPDAVLGLEGALMSRHAQPKSFTTGVGPLFRDALRRRLAPPPTAQPIPSSRRPSTARATPTNRLVPSESAPPHWLRDLNLDPRYRAVAALGTAVVQAQQEELMAAAWDQVGEIERANQVLRQAQLVRAANQAVHRNRLERLPEGVLLQITRAVHSRVLATNTATLQVSMAAKAASGAVAPSFRRIARPRGPLVRRALPPTLRTIRPVVQDLATGQIMAFVAPPVGGMATVDSVEARYRAAGGSPALGNRLPSVVVGAAQLATTAADPAGIQPGFYINPPELPGTPPRFPDLLHLVSGDPRQWPGGGLAPRAPSPSAADPAATSAAVLQLSVRGRPAQVDAHGQARPDDDGGRASQGAHQLSGPARHPRRARADHGRARVPDAHVRGPARPCTRAAAAWSRRTSRTTPWPC